MKIRLARLAPLVCAFAISQVGLANASDTKKDAAPAVVAFDWMANAASAVSSAERKQRANAAIIKARALNSGATWVCSPAGFGRPSHCSRG